MVHRKVRNAIGPDPYPLGLGKGVLGGAQVGEVPAVVRLLVLDHLSDLLPAQLPAGVLHPIGIDEEDDQARYWLAGIPATASWKAATSAGILSDLKPSQNF